jgi:hypothetical protein
MKKLRLAHDARVLAGGSAPGRLVLVLGMPLHQVPHPTPRFFVEAARGGLQVEDGRTTFALVTPSRNVGAARFGRTVGM